MPKVKLPLERAQKIADALMRRIGEACSRIAVAGSIRREKAVIGDLELVAIPLDDTDLFGQPIASRLEPHLAALVAEGLLDPPLKNGAKYKQFPVRAHRGLLLDLFLVTAETWGYHWAIRTGPAIFSKALVTNRCHRGLLPDDCKVDQSRVWRRIPEAGGVPGRWELLDTPEELDFLTLCGAVVHPRQRNELAIDMIRAGNWPGAEVTLAAGGRA